MKIRRKFLGKTEDFVDKEEQRFEQKHLKAYIKGKTQFRYGYETINGQRFPAWHRVKQDFYEA